MVVLDGSGLVEDPLQNKREIGVENVTEAPKVLTLEILGVIRDAQQQHGLRHGDYQRYRGYCSRRLRRLRKVLKVPQGDRRHFKRRDITEAHLTTSRADERLLHIPLMQSERAWSHAMQLRQESNTEPRKKFHLVQRLRKACAYALHLNELCKSDYCDARTKLESEAYVAWMHGSLHFELSLWKQAAENLKRAQLVYEGLIKALNEDDQGVYQAKVDELTPSLRYCAYNIGDESAIEDILQMRGKGLLNNIDTLVAQTRERNSETLQSIEWRNKKIAVRPEKVKLFLLSVQDLDKSVDKCKDVQSKITLIENMLMDLKDTIANAREDVKNDKSKSTSSHLIAYLSYIRLTRTIQRNLLLIEQCKQASEVEKSEVKVDKKVKNKSSKTDVKAESKSDVKKTSTQNLARFYEIILQNVTELQQLSGMENDEEYQKEIETLSKAFRSFRCYFIAEYLLSMKRYRDSVALYEKSLKYCTETLLQKPTVYDLTSQLKALQKIIEGSKFSAHAYSVLEDDTGENEINFSKKNIKHKVPLFQRLSEYREDQRLLTRTPNVFSLPPEMSPVPCKPLFFDLALNLVDFPDLEDKIGDNKKPGAQGISGFVKGFLGWGGQGK